MNENENKETESTVTKKSEKKVDIDQNFMDMVLPQKPFELSFFDFSVIARPLAFVEFAELKNEFPEWEISNVLSLLSSFDGFRAMSAIIWMGIKENTEELADRKKVDMAVNTFTLSEWNPVLAYIIGVPEINDDDDDVKPEPKQEAGGTEGKS